eukprot:CAMPEP_0168619014 /NCGR_PEP_ID=MMETSP0449_2-20121227/6379_1 /TAXON_ID=1082188 /ORGANISM="Strombidium rassoulzadegani, Strain ras09" /LENGTH=331 /DNA_ID=CAMNT_0008659927 /DNA_START=201 /DNA_END=1196 /DNA_ORIENTATION=-
MINPIIEPMALQLFQNLQPNNDPIEFMLDYLKNNFGNRPSISEGERMELDFLRKEVPRLRGAVSGGDGQGNSTASEKRGETSSEESGDDMIEDLPSAKPNNRAGPRMSVSAEVFGKFNKQGDYQPPVHFKSDQQISAIKDKMERNFMFNSLNPIDKKKILEAVLPVRKEAGDVIIKEGDDGDNFYLVESGELECTKFLKKDDAEPTKLKVYVPGESFGELALLYNAPRAATITCKSADCELWSLDRNTFNHIIKQAVQKKREKYDDFLERVEILKMMEKYERTKIADAFKEQWFDAGDYIIKQGDKDGSEFFMIIEGNIIATKTFEPGKPA